MIVDAPCGGGRFRTLLDKGSAAADAGRGLVSVWETGSADVQPAANNWSILTRTYGPPYSTLPRVPAVPHALFGGLQSLSQRFVPGLLHRARSVQALLFLR